ncbi:predicted GPI-anchored protein 58 [Phaseolus vulgaris]|uniref:predicted GPI-anchored protein 58 n=1 Tax=Phaseolus vulgaris TaxID=3885 RepID=UPI0035C9BFD4
MGKPERRVRESDLGLYQQSFKDWKDITSSKERCQKLIKLAKSRRAARSSSGTEATAEASSEPISASPLSFAPAEGPETKGEKKRKRLVKAPTTVASTEGESSGSPLAQRKRRGAEVGGSSAPRPEGAEGDATPTLPAQTSPTRPPSPAPLPSLPPTSEPLTLPSQTAGSGAARSEGTLTPQPHHVLKTPPPRPRVVVRVPSEPQIANLVEALAANEKRADDQGSKLKEAESTIATLTTEKVVLETDKAELEAEKTKLWEEAADTFAEGFDLALEQVKCVFPEADYS